MKYLKLFESEITLPYKWRGITKKNNEIHVFLYELLNEFESTVQGKSVKEVSDAEKEWMNLVRKILIGNVIRFECDECEEGDHIGICDEVEFESGMAHNDDNQFQTQYTFIKTEDFKDAHGMNGDEIIVYLDEDVELFRQTRKYNL